MPTRMPIPCSSVSSRSPEASLAASRPSRSASARCELLERGAGAGASRPSSPADPRAPRARAASRVGCRSRSSAASRSGSGSALEAVVRAEPLDGLELAPAPSGSCARGSRDRRSRAGSPARASRRRTARSSSASTVSDAPMSASSDSIASQLFAYATACVRALGAASSTPSCVRDLDEEACADSRDAVRSSRCGERRESRASRRRGTRRAGRRRGSSARATTRRGGRSSGACRRSTTPAAASTRSASSSPATWSW